MRVWRHAITCIAIVLGTTLSSGAFQAGTGEYNTMTYLEFIGLEADARHEVFTQMNAAKQAAIVRAHLLAWKEEHRDELDGAQLQFLNEAIALATPELYAPNRSSAVVADARARQEQARRIFTEEQITEVFLMRGPARRP